MRVAIGFTGVKQAGKTTSFNYLKELYGSSIAIKEIAFADRLKNTCAEVFSVPREDFDNPDTKEKALASPVAISEQDVIKFFSAFGIKEFSFDKHVKAHIGVVLETPRKIAQYVGTEVLRNVDKEIHCKGATMDLPSSGVFVFTDMRFPNEFDYLASVFGENFFPFYIDNKRAESVASLDPHPSEKFILDIAKKCQAINNNGT